jgi:hypothetical protein
VADAIDLEQALQDAATAGAEALIVFPAVYLGRLFVNVGADNRFSAEKLCADLRGAGVSYCEVQRARSVR